MRAPVAPRLHRLACLLIACALFVRLMVPAGFMLAPATNGGAVLVPCFGVPMPHPTSVGHAGKHHDRHERQMPGDHLCPFASASAALAQVALPEPASLPPLAQAQPSQPPVSDIVPGRGLAAPPPPQTGPPILA